MPCSVFRGVDEDVTEPVQATDQQVALVIHDEEARNVIVRQTGWLP